MTLSLSSEQILVLGGIVTAGSAICLASILILHLLPTGYDPMRNAVSDYGVGKYRVWHRTAVLSLAVSGLAMAIASSGTVKPESNLVVGLLVIFAVARAAIPFFPTDIEGQPLTTRGRVHWGLAIISFASLAFAAGFYEGTSLDDAIGWVVVAAVCLLLVSLLLPRFRKAFAVLERAFYFSMICWFFITGIELALLALQ
jgi:hypothetical membrane protein